MRENMDNQRIKQAVEASYILRYTHVQVTINVVSRTSDCMHCRLLH